MTKSQIEVIPQNIVKDSKMRSLKSLKLSKMMISTQNFHNHQSKNT